MIFHFVRRMEPVGPDWLMPCFTISLSSPTTTCAFAASRVRVSLRVLRDLLLLNTELLLHVEGWRGIFAPVGNSKTAEKRKSCLLLFLLSLLLEELVLWLLFFSISVAVKDQGEQKK